MRGRHHKKDDDVAVIGGDDAIQAATSSQGAAQWKCVACGAFNDDSVQVCSECTAAREGIESTPKNSGGSGSDFSDWEIPANNLQPQTQTDEEISPPVVSSPIEAPNYTPSQASGEPQYFLVFESGPSTSIQSKVSLDFGNSTTISIGRSSENVIVIPDQEVSRKHAELSMKGSKITIRDLQSTNGTFIQKGKTFERVSGSVEVKPNTVLRFGKGTIVRLTTG